MCFNIYSGAGKEKVVSHGYNTNENPRGLYFSSYILWSFSSTQFNFLFSIL